jgi:hypothetical protein
MAARLACPRIPSGGVVVAADSSTIGSSSALPAGARMARSLIGRPLSRSLLGGVSWPAVSLSQDVSPSPDREYRWRAL